MHSLLFEKLQSVMNSREEKTGIHWTTSCRLAFRYCSRCASDRTHTLRTCASSVIESGFNCTWVTAAFRVHALQQLNRGSYNLEADREDILVRYAVFSSKCVECRC
jgi:hypothetical protein